MQAGWGRGWRMQQCRLTKVFIIICQSEEVLHSKLMQGTHAHSITLGLLPLRHEVLQNRLLYHNLHWKYEYQCLMYVGSRAKMCLLARMDRVVASTAKMLQ